MNPAKFSVFIIVLLLLTSCMPPKKTDNIAAFFKNTSAKTPAKNSVQMAAVTSALVPDFNQTLGIKPQTHRGMMNISVHELNARDFFMGLVVDTDVNMLVHPEVSGTISLELKNVSLSQVLDAVQKVYGYDYKKNDIGYIIYPATMQTKTFKVDRLAMRRMGRSNISVLSGQSGNNNQGGNNPYGNTGYGSIPYNNASMYNSSGMSNNNYPGGSSGYNPYGNTQAMMANNQSSSTVSTITDSDFWQELETSLKSIISSDKNAMVVINKQSGLVVARARPLQLREIETYLDATQNQIAKQVILEAKILEIELDTSHQEGINWDILARNATLVTGFGTPNFVAPFAATLRTGNFGTAIELAESQGKTKILSSPRIATLNNQTALIKVGQDQYFITNVSQTVTSTVANQNNTQNINLSQFFSGIALDVTPQIDDNDEISLHIHPSVTRVISQQTNFVIDGQNNSLPLALNVVRESDSIIKAKNGQLIALGGLMQETAIENDQGIFGLTRIPYLGNLFRVNNGNTVKTELVILIKATIVNDNRDWQNDINTSKQRLEQLERIPQWR